MRSDRDTAKAQEAETASFAQPPELVADTILNLIRSGDAQADLVPEAYGRSFKG